MNRTRDRGASEFLTGLALFLASVVIPSARAQSTAGEPRGPLLLDVGPGLAATIPARPAFLAPSTAAPPIAVRDASAVKAPAPKSDPRAAQAGDQAAAPSPAKSTAGRRHAVRPGETFESIALAYYDSPRFARALWWANRGTVAWPGALSEGKTLAIPEVGDLDPRMVAAQQAAMDSAALPTLERITSRPSGHRREDPRVDPQVLPANAVSERPRDRAALDVRGGTAIHVVQPHETIRSIARACFGDDSRAREIAELNRDLLQAEGRPRVGQRLILPPGSIPPAR